MVTALETLCCMIAKDFGAKHANTLGQAIDYITEKNATHPVLNLPSTLKSIIDKIYGYASSEDGIRHGGPDFTEAEIANARLIIVICSSFINLLTAQWNETNGDDQNV